MNWLPNRRGEAWRMKQSVELGGKGGKSLGEELGLGSDAMLATARWVADVLSGAAKAQEPSTQPCRPAPSS